MTIMTTPITQIPLKLYTSYKIDMRSKKIYLNHGNSQEIAIESKYIHENIIRNEELLLITVNDYVLKEISRLLYTSYHLGSNIIEFGYRKPKHIHYESNEYKELKDLQSEILTWFYMKEGLGKHVLYPRTATLILANTQNSTPREFTLEKKIPKLLNEMQSDGYELTIADKMLMEKSSFQPQMSKYIKNTFPHIFLNLDAALRDVIKQLNTEGMVKIPISDLLSDKYSRQYVCPPPLPRHYKIFILRSIIDQIYKKYGDQTNKKIHLLLHSKYVKPIESKTYLCFIKDAAEYLKLKRQNTFHVTRYLDKYLIFN